MAELEIDQTNLPRVQEVCQCFAVLEDGALAHSLQEQEIEQYYTTNIQKNQLVQNDIRVAKRLQDEEEEQWAQKSALIKQASKQLEERDFEYARLIQEEILRGAKEAKRREQDDEEIAKRLHEEEKQRLKRISRGEESPSEGSNSDPELPPPHQHTVCSLQQGEEQYLATTNRWQCSTSDNHSNLTEAKAGCRTGTAALRHKTPWSNEGHTGSFREIRSQLRESVCEDSEDSDTVFSERPSVFTRRASERLSASRPRRWASLHRPDERNYRRRFSDELRVWEEEEREERDEDHYHDGNQDMRRPSYSPQERNHRKETEGLHRNTDLDRDARLGNGRERRCSRSESVRLHDRSRQSNRELARTWSYKENSDKHVRFREDPGSFNRQQGEGSSVWEMLGQVLRERGVPVRIANNGASLQIRPQSRDSQMIRRNAVPCSDFQTHQRAFQRTSSSRFSFHGDIREIKQFSYEERSESDHHTDRNRYRKIAECDEEAQEFSGRDSYLAIEEKEGHRRWKEHKCTNSHTECRRWSKTLERLNSGEEQEQHGEKRQEQLCRRALQRSQSLSFSRPSARNRSRHMAAGASLHPEQGEAGLDLGELQQVLQDEELARKLQEHEEKLLRRKSQSSPCSTYPEGDFKVAQVAQDEEIAHFMQKQEIRSKRRSRELEGPSSWREHRAMISHHDRHISRDRQVQRERLDSEGLPSPTDDCSPENQPPSPSSTILPTHHIRNIAEELDPTFQARVQGTESHGLEPTGSAVQSVSMPHSGLHEFLEEPTFIPPTKRQTDKTGRPKAKDKKENCKQQ